VTAYTIRDLRWYLDGGSAFGQVINQKNLFGVIKVRSSEALTFLPLSVSRSVFHTFRDEAFLRRSPELFVGGGGVTARVGGVSLTSFS
jgi:hypothetical protein